MAKLILLLGALFSASIAQARNPISDTKIHQIYSQFQYNTPYELVRLKKAGHNKKNERCHRFNFDIKTSYPGAPEPVHVTGILYTPNPKHVEEGEQLPFVIQLPPMGGTNVLDRWMGGSLCFANMAGFIIGNDFTGFDDKTAPPVDDHDHAHRRTVAALKAAMVFAERDTRYNHEKIGLLGVSLGGILGSMAMSVLDEISAGYFIVAGADIPHILAASKEKRVAKLRKLRMKEQNFSSEEEYEAWLRRHLVFDPFDVARRVPYETVYMVISSADANVPSEDQFLLHQGFNRPEHIVKGTGHVGTVINTLLWAANRKKIIKWYQERFALDNPRINRIHKELPTINYVQRY